MFVYEEIIVRLVEPGGSREGEDDGGRLKIDVNHSRRGLKLVQH
jgi:hypothetical protein